MTKQNNLHIPVLYNETINLMNIKPDGVYVDCTAGRGGHSSGILKKLKNGKLICLDIDDTAIAYLQNKFKKNTNVIITKENFSNINNVLKQLSIKKVDGMLLDLGVSSPMFDDISRGFSYHNSSTLDMRMDNTQKLDAKYIVNNYSFAKLKNIFTWYGNISNPTKVINGIIKYREQQEINTTDELVNIIKQNVSFKEKTKDKHPAKQYFYALRVEVNNEINNLKSFLDKVVNLINKTGRVLIITFNSLEEKIVKNSFVKLSINTFPKEIPIVKDNSEFVLLTKKPIIPTDNEVAENYRARSSKLWGVEKK